MKSSILLGDSIYIYDMYTIKLYIDSKNWYDMNQYDMILYDMYI